MAFNSMEIRQLWFIKNYSFLIYMLMHFLFNGSTFAIQFLRMDTHNSSEMFIVYIHFIIT